MLGLLDAGEKFAFDAVVVFAAIETFFDRAMPVDGCDCEAVVPGELPVFVWHEFHGSIADVGGCACQFFRRHVAALVTPPCQRLFDLCHR